MFATGVILIFIVTGWSYEAGPLDGAPVNKYETVRDIVANLFSGGSNEGSGVVVTLRTRKKTQTINTRKVVNIEVKG